jgi:tetratricopeptide (TPR) repeat protein
MKGNLILVMFFSGLAVAEDISLCRQGWTQYQYGEYEQSIQLFNQCINQGDLTRATLAQTYRNMGIVANGSQRPEEAIVFYDKAIALEPEEVWYDLVNKGNAYSGLGEYEAAIQNYQLALTAKPHFNEAYYNMGLVYDRTGQVDEAISNYKLALKHGLQSPQLMERVQYHGIVLEKIDQFKNLSVATDTKTFLPVNQDFQVSTLGSYTCQAFVGRGIKDHPSQSLIKASKVYSFSEHNLEFKLPSLPLRNYQVADHLNNAERGVKDSYLLFADDLLGDIGAAVVVTEFPSHVTDQTQLMAMTKGLENSLSRGFSPDQVVIRELTSDYGNVLELMVYNRGPSPCFPTSEFKKSPASTETMGISRFVYRDNLMIEFALIVVKPPHITKAGLASFARSQMDLFWSGLIIK